MANLKTIACILGTRPEGIKMAPVIRELRQYPQRARVVVISTGQHRQMLDQVLRLFDITPDVALSVMQPDQSLAQLTSTLLTAIDRTCEQIRPDWVLAQGDTTSVLAAALIAFYRRIKFGHVEAGLRSGNRAHPFPEEINRRVADLVTDAYFAPTKRAEEMLLREGADRHAVHLTGNTVVDALRAVAERPYDMAKSGLPQLPAGSRLVLITAHRRESFGEPFRDLCTAIRDLAQMYREHNVQFIYPVHLNPNVQRPVNEILAGLENVHLIPPVDYLVMVQLMKRASLVLTDSGGIQEEAPSFNIPVLVMRETTERPEGVQAGVAMLVGTRRNDIVRETAAVLDGHSSLRAAAGTNPYGDGHAAERIGRVILDCPA